MTARVLVVDDLPANIKLLETRLSAEYFDVIAATNGPDALKICQDGRCDLVLLDVMMPGMDGFEVCRRLKADAATMHIPVIMVTALDQPADRVKGLEAGADDFLTKPVDEIALIARVRSLARLKVSLDELRARAMTAQIGRDDPFARASAADGKNGSILLVDDRISSSERIVSALRNQHSLVVENQPQDALFKAAEGVFDLIIVSLGLESYDGLRLCSQLRSLERTRALPLLMIADLEDRAKILRGLDLGVNDYLMRPIDPNELIARARTQIRRKRYADHLRDNVEQAIEMAIVDGLTGLHNRRYYDMQISALLNAPARAGKPLSMLLLDIDFFKKINDTHGHDAGDEVLRALAARIRRAVRGVDLVCRLGGEEFAIIMPDTPIHVAARVAERVRRSVEAEPFQVKNGAMTIPVTISVGISDKSGEASAETIYKRADLALYRSKNEGRNRVTLAAA